MEGAPGEAAPNRLAVASLNDIDRRILKESLRLARQEQIAEIGLPRGGRAGSARIPPEQDLADHRSVKNDDEAPGPHERRGRRGLGARGGAAAARMRESAADDRGSDETTSTLVACHVT